MNKIFYTLVILLITNTIFAQGKIELTVNNVIIDGGDIRIAIYNNDDSFLKTPFKVAIIKPNSKVVNIVIPNLPEGVYAISLYQDENTNEDLDMGMFGPKEPYGFSNNAKGKFGPAKFADAKFEVTSNSVSKQNISLN